MSVVQICNRGASRYLGLPRVNSLDEGTPQSEQYELHYDDLRRSLLERHWWVFAKRIQALARVTNDRPEEWKFRYQRPSNVLDVHWVNDPAVATAAMRRGDNPDSGRQNYGEFIYSNVDKAWIEFTCDEENTDLMPQYFKDALSAMVAAAVAMPLTESVARARFAGEQAEAMIDMAIARDEEMMPPIDMPAADYLRARDGTSDPSAGPNGWGR